ncbi:ankyrin repeat-containing protein [Fusarium tricinctum]|uniref:Ankyrin repeat-containing protein n=1 Tax=Fusarium tricinctum TaxID=61284 RepID=A0A8K0WH03_9HYPO|nr:ankyrin repeat-containing protein [Fusarium tricinctum]
MASPVGGSTPSSTPSLDIDPHRSELETLLRYADLSLPEPPEPLDTSGVVYWCESSSSYTDEERAAARALLVSTRTSHVSYRRPDLQRRHIFRTPSRKSLKMDVSKWTFTKHEVGKAFDALIKQDQTPDSRIAYLVLSSAELIVPLEAIWAHFLDPGRQKRQSSILRPSHLIYYNYETSDWLNIVTEKGYTDFIRLMGQCGLSKQLLDEALPIALANSDKASITALLQLGATVDSSNRTLDILRRLVRQNNVDLIKLVLSAKTQLRTVDWRYCLESDIAETAPSMVDILLHCLHHDPLIASGQLLLDALNINDTSAAVVLLAYLSIRRRCSTPRDCRCIRYFLSVDNRFKEHESIAVKVCQHFSTISDYKSRYNLYFLLQKTGLLRDVSVLRQEISQSVLGRRISMIELLLSGGVRPSIKDVIESMDFPMLEIMVSYDISPQEETNLLSFIPRTASEDDIVRIIEILASEGSLLTSDELNQELVSAVSKNQHCVVAALLKLGAQATYKSAAAINIALTLPDVEMIHILLTDDITPECLSPTLEVAMNIEDRTVRQLAIQMLAKKGVTESALCNQLAQLILSPNPDLDLIGVIAGYSISTHSDGSIRDAFHLAMRQANLEILELFCTKDLCPDTAPLSEAMPLALLHIAEDGGNVTFEILSLLLQRCSHSKHMDETLIIAAGLDGPRAHDILRLLVKHGADANYELGKAYTTALTRYSMLEILCQGCPVQQNTFEVLFPLLIDARVYSYLCLELVLRSACSMNTNVDLMFVPKLLVGNRNITTIVLCLMGYGLDVNSEEGIIFRFAVDEGSIFLLKVMLSTHTTTESLAAAFRATQNSEPRGIQLEMMRLVLEKASLVRDQEVGQCCALLQETLYALPGSGDWIGLQLLLQHGASVNANNAEALCIAAAKTTEHTEALRMLLSYKPSKSSIEKACMAAAVSPLVDRRQKKVTLTMLLDSEPRLTSMDLSDLLHTSINECGDCKILPEFLITRGIKITDRHLQDGLTKASKEVFALLADNMGKIEDIGEVFTYAITTPMETNRRLWVYRTLLKHREMLTLPLSEALVGVMEDKVTDVKLPKLLLKCGGRIDFREYRALKLSFQLEQAEITEMFVNYIKDRCTASVAFELARTSTVLEPNSRHKIYSRLLEYDIGCNIGLALVDTLRTSQDIAIIQLLLKHGANPNENGAICFILACDAKNNVAFLAMCVYADIETVARALLEHYSSEQDIIEWMDICFTTQSSRREMAADSDLLYVVMTKFPSGGALAERLLKNGISAGTLREHRFCGQWSPEVITPLLWALGSSLKISNRSLLALVAQGYKAKPLYTTLSSCVTAAFLCLLDSSRTPVLKALVKFDKAEIASSIITGSSFSYLSQHPSEPDTSDPIAFTEELPLGQAALYLGNFRAYRSLGCGEVANDGSLHTAAFLALPEFVRCLLDWHSADFDEIEEFGNMIPLVVACRATFHPWCRVANAEASFEQRRKDTMALLVKRTDLTWRHRKKTVLHFAIEGGLDALNAMLEALDVASDPNRDERYLYTDRGGIVYSPSYYISHVYDPNNQNPESKVMIQVLQTARLIARMYRPTTLGSGVQQPEGYCGLPDDL